jgi:hypothetical protein
MNRRGLLKFLGAAPFGLSRALVAEEVLPPMMVIEASLIEEPASLLPGCITYVRQTGLPQGTWRMLNQGRPLA